MWVKRTGAYSKPPDKTGFRECFWCLHQTHEVLPSDAANKSIVRVEGDFLFVNRGKCSKEKKEPGTNAIRRTREFFKNARHSRTRPSALLVRSLRMHCRPARGSVRHPRRYVRRRDRVTSPCASRPASGRTGTSTFPEWFFVRPCQGGQRRRTEDVGLDQHPCRRRQRSLNRVGSEAFTMNARCPVEDASQNWKASSEGHGHCRWRRCDFGETI